MPPCYSARAHSSSEGGHCPFRLRGHFKKKLPPWSTTLFFLHIPLKLLLTWGPRWSTVKPSKMRLAVGNIIEMMFKSNIITNKWAADTHATCALALQPCFHEAVPIAHFNANSAIRWQGCMEHLLQQKYSSQAASSGKASFSVCLFVCFFFIY